MLKSLRERLDEIMDEGNGSEWQIRKNHADKIAAIKKQFPHRISLEETGPNKPEEWIANCFVYAFGFDGDLFVKRINEIRLNINGQYYFGSRFVQSLLQEKFLEEVSQEDMKDGDIIIYFEEHLPCTPKHAGIIEGELVKSKWAHSNVYKHPKLEAPLSYGNDCRIYRMIEKDGVKRRLQEFYIHQGLDQDCP